MTAEYKPNVGDKCLIFDKSASNNNSTIEYTILWKNDTFVLFNHNNITPILRKWDDIIVKPITQEYEEITVTDEMSKMGVAISSAAYDSLIVKSLQTQKELNKWIAEYKGQYLDLILKYVNQEINYATLIYIAMRRKEIEQQKTNGIFPNTTQSTCMQCADALNICQDLINAYEEGQSTGGSIQWETLDEVYWDAVNTINRHNILEQNKAILNTLK